MSGTDKDNDYLWTGTGDDALEVASLERAVADLQMTPTRPPRRRTWIAALIASLFTALLAFAAIGPTKIPTRFLGLFTDAPVTALSLDGGSVIELDVTGADAELTEAVGAQLERRGAEVTYTREGKIIVELPGVFGEEAVGWAERMSSKGRVSLGWSVRDVGIGEALSPGPLAEGEVWRYEKSERGGSTRVRAHAIVAAMPAFRGFARAEVMHNAVDGRLEIRADLFANDREGFATLTRENVGKRLALMLDDQVLMAPVIQTEINGGTISITLADEVSEVEAKALAAVIGNAELAADTSVAHIESVYPQISEGAVYGVRGLLAGLFGMAVFLLTWLTERRSRAIDPHVAPLRGVPRRSTRAIVRTLISAAVVIGTALVARMHIGSPMTEGMLDGYQPTLGMLGIAPLLGGFALAALVGSVTGKLRAGTRAFSAVAIALGLGLAVLSGLQLFASDASGFTLTGVHLTWQLAAGIGFVGALAAVALLVGGRATTSGFVLVAIGMVLEDVIGIVDFRSASFAMIAHTLIGYACIAVATAFVVRRRFRVSDTETRRVGVGWAAAAVATVALLWVPALSSTELVIAFGSQRLVDLIVGVAVAAVFGLAHFRSQRVSGATVVGESASRAWLPTAAAALVGLGFVSLLLASETLGLALAVSLITAVSLDDYADWVALVRNPELTVAAELHDSRQVDPVSDALVRAGIDVHCRSQYVRHLLGPLGTFAPVAIMVPAHRLDEARAVISGQV